MPHFHKGLWCVPSRSLDFLVGVNGNMTLLVRVIEAVFRGDVDVRVGNGFLNYINGYVVTAKTHHEALPM